MSRGAGGGVALVVLRGGSLSPADDFSAEGAVFLAGFFAVCLAAFLAVFVPAFLTGARFAAAFLATSAGEAAGTVGADAGSRAGDRCGFRRTREGSVPRGLGMRRIDGPAPRELP